VFQVLDLGGPLLAVLFNFFLPRVGTVECGHRREGHQEGEAGGTRGHVGSCQSNFFLDLCSTTGFYYLVMVGSNSSFSYPTTLIVALRTHGTVSLIFYCFLSMLQADAILDKMQNNGMMKEIADSQETTLLITSDQVCSLHLFQPTLLHNLA
jgi:hypothetical protein